MEVKTKRADVIYNQMIMTEAAEIAPVSLKVMNLIQGEKVSNQILGLTATLLCLLDQYGLSHIDALAEANNIVFSGEDGNMLPDFKSIGKFTQKKWELN